MELLARRGPGTTPWLAVSALGGPVASAEIGEHLLRLFFFTSSASSGCRQHQQGDEGQNLLVFGSEEIRGTEDK